MARQDQKRLLLDKDEESQHCDSTMEAWLIHPPTARRVHIVLKAFAPARPAYLLALLKRIGYCFVPQLIRTKVFDDPAPSQKQFPTSYLNGLRGLAALKVFTFHYFMVFKDATHIPYGADERHTYLTELPVIRYLWTGFTSHIFFGLAGYLTCHRLFILLDKNDQASHAKVLVSVSGSLFRRALRLYLPVFAITLLMTSYIHLGFYETNRPLLLNWSQLFPGDWNETKPEMYASWGEQLRFWASEMYQLCNFVSADTVYPLHDQHLWSILAEMRASFHLHGIIVALAQVKRQVRTIALWMLVLVYFWWQHWEIWVYVLGAVVAQIDQILSERAQKRTSLPTASGEKHEHARSLSSASAHAPPTLTHSLERCCQFDLAGSVEAFTANRALRALGFMVAFYLLSFPIHGARGDRAPGYETLGLLIPAWMERKDKFYANWGTFLLLLLLVRSPAPTSWWRRILSHWLPQYLGQISFAFYLVQQLVQHAFGYLIPHHIWWSFGVEGVDVGDVPWISAIAAGWCFTLAAALWMADCWAREVEGRCIKLVKWLERKCFR